MSADFWAGYISGAAGIIIGNPLDIMKVRLQASSTSTGNTTTTTNALASPAATLSSAASVPGASTSSVARLLRLWVTGTAAPILGYGALNALLFVSYNRSEAALNRALGIDGTTGAHLGTTWVAGAVGGLATFVVSTPTELVKCRAQVAASPVSSWALVRQVLAAEGIRGLYFGGTVTALRDSIGYGFYFWSYELASRWMAGGANHETAAGLVRSSAPQGNFLLSEEALRVLLCGGLAGIATWASIFPLDVIKTKLQTQNMDRWGGGAETQRTPLLAGQQTRGEGEKRLGAWEITKRTYRDGGIRPFFRGLAVCSVRAFIVNAFQWAVYEWIMLELGHGRKNRQVGEYL